MYTTSGGAYHGRFQPGVAASATANWCDTRLGGWHGRLFWSTAARYRRDPGRPTSPA